jgi:hypothetical protein
VVFFSSFVMVLSRCSLPSASTLLNSPQTCFQLPTDICTILDFRGMSSVLLEAPAIYSYPRRVLTIIGPSLLPRQPAISLNIRHDNKASASRSIMSKLPCFDHVSTIKSFKCSPYHSNQVKSAIHNHVIWKCLERTTRSIATDST